MLSEQELDTLYGEVNRPYSPKELTAHLADREVKSALEARLSRIFRDNLSRIFT